MSHEMTLDEAMKIIQDRNIKEMEFQKLAYAWAKTIDQRDKLKEKLKEAKEIIGYFVDNSPASIIRVYEFEKRAEKFIEDLKVDQGEIKCILTLKELEKPHQVKNYLFIQLIGKIC